VWKPKGYNSVSPYFVVANPQSLIDFMQVAFGAVPLRRHETPDGRIAHAEVRIDDTVLMLGDAGDGSSTECNVHIYVEDVDATFARAIAVGGKSVQAPVKKGDSDKRGGIADPTGTVTFWIGTQVE
jgi:PhnB protein